MFKWEYLSFSPLLFTSPLFTPIFKASPDNHFAFLHLFSILGHGKYFMNQEGPVQFIVLANSKHINFFLWK